MITVGKKNQLRFKEKEKQKRICVEKQSEL